MGKVTRTHGHWDFYTIGGKKPKGSAGGKPRLLDLKRSPVKDSGRGCCGSNPRNAVNGVLSNRNLRWHQCKQYSSVRNPWWMVDLGLKKVVRKVKLYNRNDCCPYRLQKVKIYLGNNKHHYSKNALVAANVNVSQHRPLTVNINKVGRYLWVARPGQNGMTMCEIQIWAGGSGAGGKKKRGKKSKCRGKKCFSGKLGSKNGVKGGRYTFAVTTTKQRGGSYTHAMIKSCRKIGMKPLCDHPSYCKKDRRSIYIGQKHHIAHKPHRNRHGFFPSGWSKIKNKFPRRFCTFTAHHAGNHRSLCTNGNHHRWQTPQQNNRIK